MTALEPNHARSPWLWLATVLLVAILAGCRAEEAPPPEPAAPQPRHPAEAAVLDLVSDLSAGRYADAPYVFEADHLLPEALREQYFRDLERYVAGRPWQLHFTRVSVYQGKDDSADVTLRSGSGDYLVFLVGYDYTRSEWVVSAYEYPGLSFQRPEGLSFEEYVLAEIDATRAAAAGTEPGDPGAREAVYFIE